MTDLNALAERLEREARNPGNLGGIENHAVAVPVDDLRQAAQALRGMVANGPTVLAMAEEIGRLNAELADTQAKLKASQRRENTLRRARSALKGRDGLE